MASGCVGDQNLNEGCVRRLLYGRCLYLRFAF